MRSPFRLFAPFYHHSALITLIPIIENACATFTFFFSFSFFAMSRVIIEIRLLDGATGDRVYRKIITTMLRARVCAPTGSFLRPLDPLRRCRRTIQKGTQFVPNKFARAEFNGSAGNIARKERFISNLRPIFRGVSG